MYKTVQRVEPWDIQRNNKISWTGMTGLWEYAWLAYRWKLFLLNFKNQICLTSIQSYTITISSVLSSISYRLCFIYSSLYRKENPQKYNSMIEILPIKVQKCNMYTSSIYIYDTGKRQLSWLILTEKVTISQMFKACYWLTWFPFSPNIPRFPASPYNII